MAQQTAVEWLDNELWKLRLKVRGQEISIDIYFSEEAMWYLTPTIGFQRINWEGITNKKEITHLFVVKWLKCSVGVIKKYCV